MHIQMIDMEGKDALIHMVQIDRPGWLRHVKAARVYETGEVLKPGDGVRFPSVSPKAVSFQGQLKCSVATYGPSRAMKWRLGFRAENGFSIPAKDSLDKLYCNLENY